MSLIEEPLPAPCRRREERIRPAPVRPSTPVDAPAVLPPAILGGGYLLLLLAVQLLSSRLPPPWPLLPQVAILVLLLLHAALCWERPLRRLPLLLALSPLGNLFLLMWPPPGPHRLWAGVALLLPLLLLTVALVGLQRGPRAGRQDLAALSDASWVWEGGRAARLERGVPDAGLEEGRLRQPRSFAALRRMEVQTPPAGRRVVPREASASAAPVSRPSMRRRWFTSWSRTVGRRLAALLSADGPLAGWDGSALQERCVRWLGDLRRRLVLWRLRLLAVRLAARRQARALHARAARLPRGVVVLQATVVLSAIVLGAWIGEASGVVEEAAPRLEPRTAPGLDWMAADGVPMEHEIDRRFQRQGQVSWQRTSFRIYWERVERPAELYAAGPGVLGWQRVRPSLAVPPPRERQRTLLPPAEVYLDEEPAELLALVERAPPAAPRRLGALPTPVELLAENPNCPFASYSNLYPRGVCTWHAKEMRPDLPSFRWDAGLADNWPAAAERCGFVVNDHPAVGAVIVYPSGANGAFPGGHVGYVVQVEADHLISSECNTSMYRVRPGVPYWYEAGHLCTYRYLSLAEIDPRVRFIQQRDSNAWLDSWEAPDELR